jgi:putative restriction endonuclease
MQAAERRHAYERSGVLRIRVAPVPPRIFGDISGIEEGARFNSRAELAEAGVHRPLRGGISGAAAEGAESIVVSGGYEDDEDLGDELIYTGHGGQNPETRIQIADQELTRQNLALAVSSDRGLPVRVVRGAGGDRAYSPSAGYRYDGLFYVERYWREPGRSGFNVWRYRLVKSPAANPVTNPQPGPPPRQSAERRYATTQRLVRNTAVTQWVKELYDYTCQVCGERIDTPSGPYAEGAHVLPVGRPHNGPDAPENVICVCPNDHVRLDRGIVSFDAELNLIEIGSGRVVGALTVKEEHRLDPQYARRQQALHRET